MPSLFIGVKIRLINSVNYHKNTCRYFFLRDIEIIEFFCKLVLLRKFQVLEQLWKFHFFHFKCELSGRKIIRQVKLNEGLLIAASVYTLFFCLFVAICFHYSLKLYFIIALKEARVFPHPYRNPRSFVFSLIMTFRWK